MIQRQISILLIVTLLLAPGMVFSCSCIQSYFFCPFIKDTQTVVAFQAVVLQTKHYSASNYTAYLRQIQTYKDQVGMTEIVKIYGSNQSADCSIDIPFHFKPGDTVMVALSSAFSLNEYIVNPDSVWEHYTEFKTSYCWSVILKVKNDLVNGPIAPGIYQYPLSHFDEALENCSFSPEVPADLSCEANSFFLYPNPAGEGFAQLRGVYSYLRLESVKLYSMEGRLIRDYGPQDTQKIIELDLTGAGLGVYYLEILCGGKRSVYPLYIAR